MVDTYACYQAHQISGLILAGGRGLRMGGVNKGLVYFRQKPLISHAIQRLQPQVKEIILSVNQEQHLYRCYGYPVLADVLPGYHGPLAGIATGLSTCLNDWLITVPVDTPFFPLDLVAKLRDTCDKGQGRLVSSVVGHPVFCCIHKTRLASLQNYLALGYSKISDWLEQEGCTFIDIQASGWDETAFTNINTSKELV